jgi:hypothetical protein
MVFRIKVLSVFFFFFFIFCFALDHEKGFIASTGTLSMIYDSIANVSSSARSSYNGGIS